MTLKIQKNSRQVPSIETYTADKMYHDLLYGVLQELSYAEVINGDTFRYVNKKDASMAKLGEKIGLSRQTTSKKLDHLLKIGLISYDEDQKRYELHYLDKTISTLIPFETLRRLNNSLSRNAINLFVYFLKRFIANNEQEYVVTMNQMKAFIGLAKDTSANNEVITDIMDILKVVGLIEFDYRLEDLKTHIYITNVRNTMRL